MAQTKTPRKVTILPPTSKNVQQVFFHAHLEEPFGKWSYDIDAYGRTEEEAMAEMRKCYYSTRRGLRKSGYFPDKTFKVEWEENGGFVEELFLPSADWH